jgi:dihydroflavonol-4-reductase
MILITGATGLLGSQITLDLIKNGKNLRLFYHSSSSKNKLIHYLTHFGIDNQTIQSKLNWFQGDIRSLHDVESACEGCDEIIHCAALVSFEKKHFNLLFQINREGTANCVNMALKLGIKKMIYISSTAAIGSDSLLSETIKRETNGWNGNENVSNYSLSKYSAEKEVWRGIEEGLNAVIVNPSVIFGAGSWNDSSLKIFRTIKSGLNYYTRGANAFVDVRDVSEIVCKLFDSTISAERFLVTGTNTSFKNLFDLISEKLVVKKPNKLAGSFLTSFAWRLDAFKSLFTRKAPTITKESARSSQSIQTYSTEKIRKQFPDFQFRELKETIDFTVENRLDQ